MELLIHPLWSIRKKDCCQWRGVHCDNTTGKDTGLSLTCPQIYPIYGNDVNKLHCLTGELNISSLFELQFLIFLELGTMTSSSSIIMYQDLTGINLQDETNWLQLVRLLPSISELYVEYYRLRDIYPSLQYANFTAFNVLDLSNNDFVQAKFPNWIFNFSSGELNISSLFELQFLSFFGVGQQ
ncbi:hypothetical protein S83_065538 [Arachis hypogaea]